MRTRFEASLDKHNALKAAEQAGLVADNMEVRMQLMESVRAGEITLEYAQKELKRIKSQGKKNGKITRAQAFSRG
jgi:hypothetical protein